MNSEDKKIGKFGMMFFVADILLVLAVVFTPTATYLETMLPRLVSSIIFTILAPASFLSLIFGQDFLFTMAFLVSPFIWLVIGMVVDKIIERRRERK